jgi:hypothetical protein
VERKSADRDAGLEQRQKDQKTLQKTDSGDNSDVVIAQISRSTPLSPSETSILSNTAALPIAAVDSMGDETSKHSHRPPAAKQTALRVAALLTALTPLALLIVAGNLTPAKQGLGTHQQLGLPPCSMLYLFGIRCPACGMTTSWSYFAKGNWIASISTNAGGFLLALLCIAIIIISAQVVRNGRLPSARIQKGLTIACVGILIVTILDWIARLQS